MMARRQRELVLERHSRMAKIFELIFPQEVTPLSSPALRLVFRFLLIDTQHDYGRQILRGETMDWKQLLIV